MENRGKFLTTEKKIREYFRNQVVPVSADRVAFTFPAFSFAQVKKAVRSLRKAGVLEPSIEGKLVTYLAVK